MSATKILKKIDSSNDLDENGNPIIHDLSDPENKVLIDLKKRGLIDYAQVYIKSGAGAVHCTVTKEGLEYIEKHRETKREIALKFIIPIFTFILGLLSSCIAHFLMK
ncbi:MAG: hypothetical protein MR599_00730 [Lactobacillus johnsonii]|uniref:hypothetical protein n=1 Tax=Lactobacillus amylovorus TaxID=1604 RepID=UPI00232B9D90|nr:hypothetical protein [Lactobacillus amylovorus]MCI6761403.1 hypothetical protein [Lactobacillus johnsonii]MDB6264781.1 hypothetical protein [Lactobacillus amylovorus]MDY4728644.1 hypothetical protein [Lactobacillus amylovorus]